MPCEAGVRKGVGGHVAGFPPSQELAVAATGWRQYFVHLGPALPAGAAAEEGAPSYWHHAATGATQWETPPEVCGCSPPPCGCPHRRAWKTQCVSHQ